MILHLRQMPWSMWLLGFDMQWFNFFLLQIAIKALTLDAIMTFLGNIAVSFNEIDCFQFAVSDKAIDNAFREFQFLSNFFNGKPLVCWDFSETIQHLKKSVQMDKQVPTHRAIIALCLTTYRNVNLLIHYFGLKSNHSAYPIIRRSQTIPLRHSLCLL